MNSARRGFDPREGIQGGVKAMGPTIDLEPIETVGLKVGTGIATYAKEFMNNTQEDIEYIVDKVTDCVEEVGGAAEECVEDLHAISSRVRQRSEQYTTDMIQLVVGLIPYDLITQVYELVKGRIARPSRAQMWRLNNPHAALWGGGAPPTELSARTYQRPEGKIPLIFVHGVNYALGDEQSHWKEACNVFVKGFEEQARIFRDADHQDKAELLFVSWDTEFNQRDVEVIIDGLSHVLQGDIINVAQGLIIWGVLWRELERRAGEVAEFIHPFFKKMLNSQVVSESTKPFVVTHSLGSFVWSKMINDMVKDGSLTREPSNINFSAGEWWTMQSAVLNTAYQPEGEFPYVANVYYSDAFFYLLVWYSSMDAVLCGPYTWAKQGLAMGAVGAGTVIDSSYQLDVSLISGPAHGETAIAGHLRYFSLVGTTIANQLPDRLRF